MVSEYINSIEAYINAVDKALKKNKIIETKGFTFKRYVTFNNKHIPLGKMIIDNINSKIFIYETFYNNFGLLCRPDITVITFKDLVSCELQYSNSIMCIKIDSNSKDYYFPLEIDFCSVLDCDIMRNIYCTLNKIIKNK